MQASSRRIIDMTIDQVESEVHKALAEAVPLDQIRNMTIGNVEEAVHAAVTGLNFIDFGDFFLASPNVSLFANSLGLLLRLSVS
jgi:hypothetical protein